MKDAPKNPKSLITQILEETLDDLNNHEEFDQAIIDDLKKLAESGELKKPQSVKQSLTITTEQNENFRN